MAEKELQEKILQYRILEARMETLMRQRQLIAEKISEIQTTLSSIDELEKSKDSVLFPIGSAAYTYGKVIDSKNIIVEIGAGVALSKPADEAKQILNKRSEEMEHAISQIEHEVRKISFEIEKLGPEIEELSQKKK